MQRRKPFAIKPMNHFWDTEYTIPPGQGFPLFGPGHFLWLLFGVGLCLVLYQCFCKWKEQSRRLCLRTVAGLLVADELFKYYIALRSGEFRPSFLPLHLCSIHIFCIAADALRPNDYLREELYAVCLPGALLALIFPGWAYLPIGNALCIHSFSAHILLLLYPLLVLAEGFRPQFRRFVRTLPVLLLTVGAVYGVNQIFGTNFMFLSRSGEGNPLAWFESFLGSPGYLLGMPVIAAGCWGLLYGVVGRLKWGHRACKFFQNRV